MGLFMFSMIQWHTNHDFWSAERTLEKEVTNIFSFIWHLCLPAGKFNGEGGEGFYFFIFFFQMSRIKNELLRRFLNVLLIMSTEKKPIRELDLDNFPS